MSQPAQRRHPTRQRILDAAAARFYRDGIVATGVDAITADAGVAKMSLYNNFSSKSALVEAYIDDRHAQWLDLYAARAAGHEDDPRALVLAVFDAYLDHAGAGAGTGREPDAFERGFRGCGQLNAAAELPIGEPGRDAVRRHKEEVEGILRGALAAIVPDRADELAEHLAFLLEGSMARAGLEGTSERVRRARAMAARLMATT